MIRNIARLSFLYVLIIANKSDCYKILSVVPTPSYSHQIPYRRLWLELHARGHEIVMITTNPIPDISLPNFTQIDISHSYSCLKELDFIENRFEHVSWLRILENYIISLYTCFLTEVFNSSEVKKLYVPDNPVKFDVLLVEFFYGPAMCAFAHRFNVPLIGLSSLGMIALNEFILGGLVLPSHEYTWEMEANTGTNLPFFKRLSNFVTMWNFLYHINFDIFFFQQKLAEKYLGPLPPLMDIMKNASLIFTNQIDILSPARPKLPNIISFNSFHVSDNPSPLSKDLEEFLDDAKEGFIYFSLGTNARSSCLPKEIKRMFCDIFAKLPYKIVWKYEQDLPEKSGNIYIKDWFPQQSILAHPKIKLFIYQGGQQSTEEAINFGVPIIAFPILGDQDYLVRRIEALGMGKYLDIRTIIPDQFENAIKEVITNKEYKERVLDIRTQIRETSQDVKKIAWWTEYVIRTKGALHLRSTLAWEPWYQRYDTDIIIFLTIVIFVIFLIVISIIVNILMYFYKKMDTSTHRKNKIH